MILRSGVAVLALVACSTRPASGSKATIVVGAWPIEVVVVTVVGSTADVVRLIPPGVEPHDLELSADDLATIDSTEAVVYLGGGFQPALERVVHADRDLDVLTFGGELLAGTDDHDQEPADHDDGAGASTEGAVDPHIWLAPARWAEVTRGVAAALATRLDDDAIRERGDEFAASLETLDAEIRAGLADCARRAFFTEHEAFAYLADAYDLEQVALTGISAEAEVTAPRLQAVIERAQADGATTVFAERGGEGRVARALGEAAGLDVVEFDPLEFAFEDANETYETRMRANLETLRTALDCT